MQMQPGSLTLVCTFRPRSRALALTYDIVLIVLGTVLIAASSYVAIRLPVAISPVPITAQTLAILLVGSLYGAARGGATVLAYLCEGAAGLPVFAGGAGGALHLTGPTGGYLVGFVLAAIVVGGLAERGWDRRPGTTALAMTIGTLAIFIPGLIWLAAFVGPSRAVGAGLFPFLPGAAVKIALATALLPFGWGIVRWLHRALEAED